MKKFISKLIGFSLGPIVGAIISFLTVPITTYFIEPSEFGKASMFSVIQLFLLSIIFLGMDQAYTREYHNEKNKKKIFQNAMFIPLGISIILMSIIFIFRDSFSNLLFSTPYYPNISLLFGLMIIFSVIERFVLLSIRMAEKAVEYSIFTIILKLLIFFCTLFLIILGNRSFLTVIYATLFGQFVGDFLLIIRYRRLLSVNKRLFDWNLMKKMLFFGLPIVVAASLSTLLNASGRFF